MFGGKIYIFFVTPSHFRIFQEFEHYLDRIFDWLTMYQTNYVEIYILLLFFTNLFIYKNYI